MGVSVINSEVLFGILQSSHLSLYNIYFDILKLYGCNMSHRCSNMTCIFSGTRLFRNHIVNFPLFYLEIQIMRVICRI